jgi:hypothetical protein
VGRNGDCRAATPRYSDLRTPRRRSIPLARPPPQDDKAALEAHVAALRVRAFLGLFGHARVRGDWEDHRYFVSCRGHPICRLTYTGRPGKEWECAIYRPSRDQYGTDGFLFPIRGNVERAQKGIDMALDAHSFPIVRSG